MSHPLQVCQKEYYNANKSIQQYDMINRSTNSEWRFIHFKRKYEKCVSEIGF